MQKQAILTNVTYLWSDSSTGTTLTTGNPGYVWVKITGTDGCADYDSSLSYCESPARG